MKLKSVLAVAAALVASSLMAVCAQAATTYSAGAVSGAAGSEVKIPVYASADSDTDAINGFIVKLTYDPTFAVPVVKGTDEAGENTYAAYASDSSVLATDSVLVSGIVDSSESNQKDLVIAWAGKDAVEVNANEDTATGLLELVDASFTVDESATGTSVVTVTVTSVAQDATTAPAAGTESGTGSITVSSATIVLGDVDGDGLVTENDYGAVLQHVANIKKLDTKYEINADVDKDSVITENDYGRILQDVANIKSLED